MTAVTMHPAQRLASAVKEVRERLPVAVQILLADVRIRLVHGKCVEEEVDGQRIYAQYEPRFVLIEFYQSRVEGLEDEALIALACHELAHAYLDLTEAVNNEFAANLQLCVWGFDPDDLPER
jgi:hypothetical protein